MQSCNQPSGWKVIRGGQKGAKTTLTLFSQGRKAIRKGFTTEHEQLPRPALREKKSRWDRGLSTAQRTT